MIHMNCYLAAVQATHQPTLQSISRLDAHSAPPLAHVRNELETPSDTEGYLLGRVWHFVLEGAIIWRPRCINRISFPKAVLRKVVRCTEWSRNRGEKVHNHETHLFFVMVAEIPRL